MHWDVAHQAIARSHNIDELKGIKAKADALSAYARQQSEAQEDIDKLKAIALRAERRIGELTGAMEKAPGARTDKPSPVCGPGSTKADQLAEAGLTKQQAHRAEQLAAIPEEEFEGRIARARAEGRPLTRRGVLSDPEPDDLQMEHEAGQPERDLRRLLAGTDEITRLAQEFNQELGHVLAFCDSTDDELMQRDHVAARVELAISELIQIKNKFRPPAGGLHAIQ